MFKPFSSKGKDFTVNRYELPSLWEQHMGLGLVASKGDKHIMWWSGSYTQSLVCLLQGYSSYIGSTLPPSLFPSLPPGHLLGVWEQSYAHAQKPRACGRITHWTKCLNTVFKEKEPLPLGWYQKETGTLKSGCRGLGRIPGVLQPPWDALSSDQCLPGSLPVGFQVWSLYELYFYLLISWFPFTFCLHRWGELYLSTPWSPPPETAFSICDRQEGTYLRMIWWGSSWL